MDRGNATEGFLGYVLLVTSVCLAASSWLVGHPRSDRHVSNLRRLDCCIQAGKEDPQCSTDRSRVQT